MKKTILLAGAALFSLGGTAIAQADPAAPAADPMQQTQPPAAEAPAPDVGAAPAVPEPTTTAPTTAAEGATASANVQADWAKYDPENKGSLTPLQFGKWIMASRGQDMSAQVDKTVHSKAADLPAVKVLNATATEFSKADTDKDHKVSQAELTAYLSA